MPVPLRNTAQRAEAKYNVTTEFPSLGLHSAAANGDRGLVEYALEHGQPINSVLDGVLPLHAACAGGNVQVVKLLIDCGADVNAPRLPRKYSNDKNRDSSAPIVGTTGSTPLHFAAANGNTEVVNILLLRGAHADRPDKHGVTPEMLAQQEGWVECAKLLRDWMANKDRDLRERPVGSSDRNGQALRSDGNGNDECPTTSLGRRRLHLKQSFDNTLNRLKLDRSLTPSTSMNTTTASPPASPSRPYLDTTDRLNISTEFTTGSRRPSLPHTLQPSTTIPPRNRKVSTPNITGTSTPQRPGSSGGATESTDQESNQGSTKISAPRRLGSKLSLINIFKKAQASESGQDSALTLSSGSIPPAESTTLLSSKGTARDREDLDPSPSQPRKSSISAMSPKRPPPRPLAVDMHNAMVREGNTSSQISSSRGRSGSTGLSSTNTSQDEVGTHSVPNSSSLSRLGVLRANNQSRNRSGSGASLTGSKGDIYFEEISTGSELDLSQIHPPQRPSILKTHARTPSGGQISGSPGARALRFDSSSTNGSNKGQSQGAVNRGLRICNSAGSLPTTRFKSVPPQMNDSDNDEDFGEPDSRASAPAVTTTYDSYPANRGVSQQVDIAEDDESDQQNPVKSPRVAILTRDRGLSFTSGSDISLSPITSNDELISRVDTFPFSINRPPVEENDDSESNLLQVPIAVEARGRGDSVSSISTTDSRHNPALSASGTTSGSDATNIPWSPPLIGGSLLAPDSTFTNDLQANGRTTPVSPEAKGNSKTNSPRRGHVPPEINIDSISSHAQAEALVQKTLQDVFEAANANEVTPSTSDSGLSPLSAKLAAYGESIALERKLRTQKESEGPKKPSMTRSPLSQSSALPEIITTEGDAEAETPVDRNGFGRQHSLEHQPSRPKMAPRSKTPKRPSTAEGVSSRRDELFFSRESSGGRLTHQSSRSASGFSTSPSSRLASFRDVNDTLWGEQIRPTGPSSLISPPISHGLNVNSTNTPSRSRTPAMSPPEVDGQLSRINSLDGPDPSTGFDTALARVASTPLGLSRTAKSSTKLAKMGFPSTTQIPTPTAASKKPFSLRGLVQGLKGKP